MNYIFFLGNFSKNEIIIIVLIIFILLGGRKIPEIIKHIRKGEKNSKNGFKDVETKINDDLNPNKRKLLN